MLQPVRENEVFTEDGNLLGQLKIEDDKPIFELYNQSGKVAWSTEPSVREVH